MPVDEYGESRADPNIALSPLPTAKLVEGCADPDAYSEVSCSPLVASVGLITLVFAIVQSFDSDWSELRESSSNMGTEFSLSAYAMVYGSSLELHRV